METDGVKDRLILFLKHKRLSQGKFEKMMDLSSGYVANIRQSIQPDKLVRIASLFPELNVSWLLLQFGKYKSNNGPECLQRACK